MHLFEKALLSFSLFLLIAIQSHSCKAQDVIVKEDSIKIIRLKDGKTYIGKVSKVPVEVSRNLKFNKIQIMPLKDGEYQEIITTDSTEVEFVTSYEQTIFPPSRRSVAISSEIIPINKPGECDCECEKYYPTLYWELKGLVMYSKSFSYGGETALGFRFTNAFHFGFGGGAERIMKDWRFPLFLHLKYSFNSGDNYKVKPFIAGFAGYVYDKISNDYNVKPALKNIFHPSPKMAGLSLGLDIPICCWLFDISMDLGYRYYTLPNEKELQNCDGNYFKLGYDEVHAVIFRLGITF